MTEAELIAEITKKKNTLEQYRTAKPAVATATVTALEEEIKKLESQLPAANPAPKRPRRAFLDECAG